MLQAINSCVDMPHFATSAPKQLKDFILKFISQEQNQLEHDYYSSMELAVISCYYPEEARMCENQMSLDQPDFSPWITAQSESDFSKGRPSLITLIAPVNVWSKKCCSFAVMSES